MNVHERSFVSLLRATGDALGLQTSAAVWQMWDRYAAIVADANQRTNLVSGGDPQQLVNVCFVDALVCEALIASGTRLIDVGAGAGAPTLPLLLWRNDLRAVLVEPRRLRADFLRGAVEELGLGDRAQVIQLRVSPAAPRVGVRGGPAALDFVPSSTDMALSRATFPPAQWLAVGVQLARRVLTFTARESPPPAPAGWALDASVSYSVPSSGAQRRVSCYERRGDGVTLPG